MSVLIYIDHADGQIKKGSLEALCYGAALAKQLHTSAEALLLGTVNNDLSSLGKYGVEKIYQAADEQFNSADTAAIAKSIVHSLKGATVLVFAQNAMGKAVAPQVAAALEAGLAAGVVALPETTDGFVVKKTVFSGKAFAKVKINTPVKILSLNANSYGISETSNAVAEIISVDMAPQKNKIHTLSVNKLEGEVPVTEAEIVVCGGRGLKAAENWYLIMDLAKAFGGAFACTRPVTDEGWRPHHEHVGQTGTQIAPNLYVGVGVSGAIQHLGGVSRSKTMVAINKDTEAPIFKVADYGIAGDLFEIVPKLIEALKQFKTSAI